MANNIWSWDAAGRELLYSPNPNPFFSLEEATFLIGVRPTAQLDDESKDEILEKVKGWLSRGLSAGIGSQVNTGYGSLVRAGESKNRSRIFQP